MRKSKLDNSEMLTNHCHNWVEPYSVESHKI
nr:MAG TPA: hypothetical protein [Caudoviricetes sp.]